MKVASISVLLIVVGFLSIVAAGPIESQGAEAWMPHRAWYYFYQDWLAHCYARIYNNTGWTLYIDNYPTQPQAAGGDHARRLLTWGESERGIAIISQAHTYGNACVIAATFENWTAANIEASGAGPAFGTQYIPNYEFDNGEEDVIAVVYNTTYQNGWIASNTGIVYADYCHSGNIQTNDTSALIAYPDTVPFTDTYWHFRAFCEKFSTYLDGGGEVTVDSSVAYVSSNCQQDPNCINSTPLERIRGDGEAYLAQSPAMIERNDYIPRELVPDRNNKGEIVRDAIARLDDLAVSRNILYSGNHEPGRYSVSWNGTDSYGGRVPSGAYYCRYTDETSRESIRVTIVR